MGGSELDDIDDNRRMGDRLLEVLDPLEDYPPPDMARYAHLPCSIGSTNSNFNYSSIRMLD